MNNAPSELIINNELSTPDTNKKNEIVAIDITEQHHVAEKTSIANQETLTEKLKKCYRIFAAQVIRLVLIIECGFCAYFTSCILNDYFYMIMLCGIVIIIIDGIFVSVKSKGRERKWFEGFLICNFSTIKIFFRFSISKFAFICIYLITICRLVVYKNLEQNDDSCKSANMTFSSRPTCFQVQFYYLM